MGRGRPGTGVELRESSIRVSFQYRGQRVRETLDLPPTPPNRKHAERLVDEIRRRIAMGTFRYADFFPESPRAQSDDAARPSTFGHLADLWIQAQGQLEDATRDQYAGAVRLWKKLLGTETPVAELTHQVLAAKVGSHDWSSPKRHNNALIALRGIFALEYRGRRALDNPMAGIENRPVVRRLPDPLTADERDRILADLRKHYDERVWAYYAFAFFTGMRPEEIIALRWSDIDVQAGTIRVQRVRTFRGTEREGSKTHAMRDVDLVGLAPQALAVMKPRTFMKRTDDGEEWNIFENPVTGRPWHDERSQRDHYWRPALRRLGIRARRSYCTRHTYATVALMRGVNPAYIALQLGHSVKMLLEVYARWIEGADRGTERRMLQAAMESNLPLICPSAPQESRNALKQNEEIGRRDWTRTNDPHHVKVVL